MDAVRLFVGYDPREAVSYHVFCESVIRHASVPVQFIPLHSGMLNGFDGQQDGTNAFIFSRYLVPYLCGYKGHAIFCDGDMVVNDDIAELWNYRNEQAVRVVKHDYKTRNPIKYIGTSLQNKNLDYPRKNWSSVIVWNCAHYANRGLTPEFVASAGSKTLHRFEWLTDDQIGDLPKQWNHLVMEYPDKEAKLYHFTLGIPAMTHYQQCYKADLWFKNFEGATSANF